MQWPEIWMWGKRNFKRTYILSLQYYFSVVIILQVVFDVMNSLLYLGLTSEQQNTPNNGATASLSIQDKERAVSHFSILHIQQVIRFDFTYNLNHPKYCHREYFTLGIDYCAQFQCHISGINRIEALLHRQQYKRNREQHITSHSFTTNR